MAWWTLQSQLPRSESLSKSAERSLPQDAQVRVQAWFDEINARHFDGFLDRPVLRFNSRLRSSAGRFIPGARSSTSFNFRASMRESFRAGFGGGAEARPPVIELATYLFEEAEAEKHLKDTLAHEMIHLWLWVRRRPYGHTDEFWTKMTAMGVSRYNPVPRTRPPRYLYGCPACGTEYPARRKLGPLACARCCKAHSGGRYDARFRLALLRDHRASKPSEE